MKNVNELISVSEVNDERYEVIDKLVDKNELKSFFKAVETIQKRLDKHDIEAKEQYEYLVTLMINQC